MMTAARLDILVKDRQSQLDDIQTILDTADKLKQDLSTEQAAEVAAGTEKIRALDRKIVDARHDLAVIAEAKSLSEEVGLPAMDGGAPTPPGRGHIALSGKHGRKMAASIVTAMPKDQTGRKALASGQQTTSTIVLPQVVPEGRPAVSILDVLPSRVVSPNYVFLRQSARTLAAAPVPEGGTKPTSVLSVASIQNRLRVVAHLSEQIPRYLLADQESLQQFVEDELIYGLRRGVETQVISGDGVGEDFTGILSTSGIVAQAFVTDALTSIRTAMTTLHVSGYDPAVIAVSAQDWQSIELQAATTTAVAYQGVPVNASERKLWAVPVVLSQVLGAKTALVLAEDAVTVDHDGEIDIRWSENVASDFSSNFLRCRLEGRFGVSVNQPGACVKVATG